MIDLNRVLVIGGSGMVGSQVSFGIKPTHAELDILDTDSVEHAFEAYAPQAVVHLAGLIDVQECEKRPQEAERINVGGARNVAHACASRETPLVYFSSCMVFDGTKETPYDESDEPNPQTVYGQTKLDGEKEVLRIPSALVVRTGWLFGGFEKDTKFVKRFIDSMKMDTPVRATSDRYGSPTYIPDLLAETVKQLQLGTTGIVHVVNDGVASYFEIAEKIKEIIGSNSVVSPVTQQELNPHEAPRGPMEALVSNRQICLRSYGDALPEYSAALR